MLAGYKYRIYPNKEQQNLIHKTFGCCRFVYNTMLAHKKNVYEEEHKSMNRIDCNNYVNRVLKNEYDWLKEVDKFALTNAVYDMDSAYQKFFKEHAGYPKFKSKKSTYKSYTTNNNKSKVRTKKDSIRFEGKCLRLPKLGNVRIKQHRPCEGRIHSVTVSQSPSGKYYASVLAERYEEPLPETTTKVGIDLGIKNLVICSNGYKFTNEKTISKYEKKLARLQRQLSRKVRGSANYQKKRKRIAKCHEKIVNCRKDYLHKVSRKLIYDNQVIVSETLSVKSMLQDNDYAKFIADCSWYELARQLEYKASWYGRTYLKVDTYFPSSQLCNACGSKNASIKDLTIRKWTCPVCGAQNIDRDSNAAKNILEEGMRMLAS